MFFEINNSDALQSAWNTLCSFLTEHNASKDGVFNSKLVVYELVGNVLRHAKGVATVLTEVDGGYVRLEVRSSSPFTPPDKSRCSDVYAENGRGLFIVDKVCEERVFTPDGGIQVKIRIR